MVNDDILVFTVILPIVQAIYHGIVHINPYKYCTTELTMVKNILAITLSMQCFPHIDFTWEGSLGLLTASQEYLAMIKKKKQSVPENAVTRNRLTR